MSSKGLKPHRGHKKYILVSLIQAIMWKCHQRSSQHKRPSPTATMSFTPSKPVILGGWGGYLHVNGLPGWNKLHDPMDCSLPGSSTHGIFQARVLEWVAITFSGPEGSGFQTFESGNTSWRRWPRRWGLCPDPRTSPLFFCVQLGCHLEKRLPLLKEKNRIFKISSLLSSSL